MRPPGAQGWTGRPLFDHIGARVCLPGNDPPNNIAGNAGGDMTHVMARRAGQRARAVSGAHQPMRPPWTRFPCRTFRRLFAPASRICPHKRSGPPRNRFLKIRLLLHAGRSNSLTMFISRQHRQKAPSRCSGANLRDAAMPRSQPTHPASPLFCQTLSH